jgi:hypothetical protein
MRELTLGDQATMSQQISLDIPDAVFQPIARQAQETGKKTVEIINEWLARMAVIQQDRLRRWAGAFASGVADAAERNHDYLGPELMPEAPGKKDD